MALPDAPPFMDAWTGRSAGRRMARKVRGSESVPASEYGRSAERRQRQAAARGCGVRQPIFRDGEGKERRRHAASLGWNGDVQNARARPAPRTRREVLPFGGLSSCMDWLSRCCLSLWRTSPASCVSILRCGAGQTCVTHTKGGVKGRLVAAGCRDRWGRMWVVGGVTQRQQGGVEPRKQCLMLGSPWCP